jgi:hypothetical protein
MRIRTLFALFLTAAAAAPGVSVAAVQTFTSKAAFLAATSSTDATGALPNLGKIGAVPLTVGSITYSPVGSPIYSGPYSTALPGNVVALDFENLDISPAAAVYSLGFDFVEPSVGGIGPGTCYVPACVDSTFTVTLLNSASVVVGSFTFNAPDDVAAFVGVTSSQAFSKVQIRELVTNADDEYFGRVYTSTTQVLAVPEPGSAALFLFGLAGAALVSRRRR